MAILISDYHEEVPVITVIADIGRSKQTHTHSYNAFRGVAIIVGNQTGKRLHIVVRNKYCYVFLTAKNKQKDPQEHECFKNWDSDNQSME